MIKLGKLKENDYETMHCLRCPVMGDAVTYVR